MSELEQLKQAARQLIDTDRMLAGDWLAPGVSLRPSAPAAAPAAARPVAPATLAQTAPPRPAAKPVPPVAQPIPAGQRNLASPTAAPAAATATVPLPVLPELTPEGRVKLEQLARIADTEVRLCGRCTLCQSRTHCVFGEGNPESPLMFIGEAPGEDEDLQGRPFVGRAGELLTRMIIAMGLTRGDVYIANILKCRPPDNRPPAPKEVAACWDYLIRQIKIIRPRVIVTLGNPATHAILKTTVGITRLRGQWQTLPSEDPDLAGIKVMPTYHPSFVLRSYTPENRKNVWLDLQEVMRELGIKK